MAQIDVVDIVDKLSQFNLIRPHRISNDWYQCYCPFHNEGNERKPSFGILLKDQYRNGQTYPAGFSHCFTCGFAKSLPDMITDILSMKDISMSGYDWLVDNVPGFKVDDEFQLLIPETLSDQLNNKFALEQIAKKSDVHYVSEDELAKYRFVVPYMYERKLTDDVIEKYDIGVDLNWVPPGRSKAVPCITFPVHDMNGRTLFVARRSIKGKLFNYPTGVTKPVYGIDMIPKGCKSVIIMESCFNALTAVVYGYNAVALFGTGNSYQIDQLKKLGVSEFVICTDGDEAGRRSANKLKKALSSVAFVWVMPIPDGKDANDLSKSEFDEIYARRQ